MASAKSDARKARFSSAIVTLKVGPKASPSVFTIHEATIKQSSPFFRTALEKKWKEGATLEIPLPEDEANTVTAYLEWLQSNRINLDKTDDGKRDLEYQQLTKAYIFGEKIQDDKFCNDVVDAFTGIMDEFDNKKKSRDLPDAEVVGMMYEGLPAGSPMRQMVIGIYAERAIPSFFDEEQEYPAEFMKELLVEMSKWRAVLAWTSAHQRRLTWHKKEQ